MKRDLSTGVPVYCGPVHMHCATGVPYIAYSIAAMTLDVVLTMVRGPGHPLLQQHRYRMLGYIPTGKHRTCQTPVYS
ncbi:hypothetical protein KIPB_012942, partial [Kipferlia bialata]|eukprot:g12942.t1